MISPFVPHFPPYAGPHPVGTIDVEIPISELASSSIADIPDPSVKTVAFRVFYPCEPLKKSQKPVRWISNPQRGVVAGYGRFLGASSTSSEILALFSQSLYFININAHRDAPLLPSPHSSKRWPLMVFSHGLGGSRNAYSYFCGSMASYGMVVIAPDHRDGSQPVAYIRGADGKKTSSVDYRLASHEPSAETWKCRDEQLHIRLAELALVHEALRKIDTGDKVSNLDSSGKSTAQSKKGAPPRNLLETFKDSMDMHRAGSIVWAGHSFGAATTIQFVKSVYYSRTRSIQTCIFPQPASAQLAEQVDESSSVILLDPWGLPISSPSTSKLREQPLPCFSSTSSPGGERVLAILSEAFLKWKSNFKEIQNALSDPLHTPTSSGNLEKAHQNRPSARIFYAIRSAHLSQSDFGILFPRITKYFAKAEDPERTLKLNIRAVLQCLREAGIPVARTSASDMEDPPAASAVSKKAKNDDDGNIGKLLAASEGAADKRILCTEKGSVQGWAAVGADEGEQVLDDIASASTLIASGGDDDGEGTVPADDPKATSRGTIRRSLTGASSVVISGGKAS